MPRRAVHDGDWQLLECAPAWDGNWTHDCFIAFAWQGANDERLVVVVNYAPNQSQCYVRPRFANLAGSPWRLEEQLDAAVYERGGSELQSRGLYVDAPAWHASVFAVTRR